MTKAVSEFMDMLLKEEANIKYCWALRCYQATLLSTGCREVTVYFDGVPMNEDLITARITKEFGSCDKTCMRTPLNMMLAVKSFL